MKTYFDKDTQQWVSYKPRAFWLGINDLITKEKIYSDEDFYYFCVIWHYVKGVNDSKYIDPSTFIYYLNDKYNCYKHRDKYYH